MRQNIGWFDDTKNAPGALTTRLAVDATEIHGLLCLLRHYSLTFFVLRVTGRLNCESASRCLFINCNVYWRFNNCFRGWMETGLCLAGLSSSFVLRFVLFDLVVISARWFDGYLDVVLGFGLGCSNVLFCLLSQVVQQGSRYYLPASFLICWLGWLHILRILSP